MNIKILDSWLRDFLETPAKPQDLAEKLSLTSLSVERIEKYNNDYLYEMEITTNRPDLFSVTGIAKEAAAILPQFGISAKYNPPKLKEQNSVTPFPIQIINDPKLVNRVCAAVLEVKVGESPKEIKERLETSGIRSLNNVIDITNYVMRTIGHPTHVFDLDRLNTKTLRIEEGKKGQKIKTLDNKEHSLLGGEIVAVNDKREIVDLLGIMGLENSVVTDTTKRIMFFIDNNEPAHMRKTSMELAIRTEAATLNEKGIDPELAKDALLYGIDLFEKIANGKLYAKILDIYPNKPKDKTIEVSFEKINRIIRVDIDIQKSKSALEKLGFEVTVVNKSFKVKVPSSRANDVSIDEDIIEEVARIYGYHNLPSLLPFSDSITPHPFVNNFYWEKRTKDSLKYWGLTETYTYSMISENMLEEEEEKAVKIQNPLTEDFVYMRTAIVPSLLKVVNENKSRKEIKIFEIANIYLKRSSDLPLEVLTLAGLVKKEGISFYEVKGIIEQLFNDLGIEKYSFKNSQKTSLGASVFVDKSYVGEIEVLDSDLIDFELNFELITKYSSLKKNFKTLAKFPPIVEDIALILPDNIQTSEVISEIKLQSSLVVDVTLLDQYKDTRTFHIVYQDPTRNLTSKETGQLREKLLNSLKEKFGAKLKEKATASESHCL